MSEKNHGVRGTAPTRRQLIAGGAGAVAALVLGASTTRAQETMSETQSTGPEGLLTSLHQEVELKSSLIESMTFFFFTAGSVASFSPARLLIRFSP